MSAAHTRQESLEELSRDELLEIVRSSHLSRRSSFRSFDVWKAVSQLRELQGAVPMLKVLLDYLDPPRQTMGGKEGWPVGCLVCEQPYFYSAHSHHLLCPECAPTTARYMLDVGRDHTAAIWQNTQYDMTLFAKPEAKRALAQHLRALASYMDGEP